MEDPNSDWKDEFLRIWGGIEDTYAVALDREESSFDDEDKKYIDQAINNLEVLVLKVLERGKDWS